MRERYSRSRAAAGRKEDPCSLAQVLSGGGAGPQDTTGIGSAPYPHHSVESQRYFTHQAVGTTALGSHTLSKSGQAKGVHLSRREVMGP